MVISSYKALLMILADSARNTIGLEHLCNNGVCCNNCSIPDMNAKHHRDILPDPDIVANDGYRL